MKWKFSTASACSLLGITAGVLYLANPFAAPLFMPLSAVPSIASDLGGQGQPYARIFDGTDILSGLLNISACLLLYFGRRASRPFWWVASLVALVIEGAGAILAALFPLPLHGDSPAHVAFSRMDSIGVMASLWLFAFCNARGKRKRWLTCAMLVSVTCLLYLLIDDERVDGMIERVAIIETALWIAVFPSLRETA